MTTQERQQNLPPTTTTVSQSSQVNYLNWFSSSSFIILSGGHSPFRLPQERLQSISTSPSVSSLSSRWTAGSRVHCQRVRSIRRERGLPIDDRELSIHVDEES